MAHRLGDTQLLTLRVVWSKKGLCSGARWWRKQPGCLAVDPLDLGWCKGVSGGKDTGWGPWQAPGENELAWLCGQGTGRKGTRICDKEV